jgi:hypothetical protein
MRLTLTDHAGAGVYQAVNTENYRLFPRNHIFMVRGAEIVVDYPALACSLRGSLAQARSAIHLAKI